jgi:antitoxin component YwqK of YwqJK toxin-antitoxin module
MKRPIDVSAERIRGKAEKRAKGRVKSISLRQFFQEVYGIPPEIYERIRGFICRNFWPNGSVKEMVRFKGSLFHGIQREYHDNGLIKREVRWENGKRDGVTREWYKNGNLYFEGYWTMGKQDGDWKYLYNSESQDIMRHEHWDLGKKEGDVKIFYKNGVLKSKIPFLNGLEHGTSKYWNDDMMLTKESEWKCGKRHGISRLFNHTKGNVLVEIIWRNGKQRAIRRILDNGIVCTLSQHFSFCDYLDNL